MSVQSYPMVQDGDVIEIDGAHGPVTALVLLATDAALVLDLCDGTTPLVLERADLRTFRVFRDTPLAAVA
jgi:hypothetical protein